MTRHAGVSGPKVGCRGSGWHGSDVSSDSTEMVLRESEGQARDLTLGNCSCACPTA